MEVTEGKDLAESTCVLDESSYFMPSISESNMSHILSPNNTASTMRLHGVARDTNQSADSQISMSSFYNVRPIDIEGNIEDDEEEDEEEYGEEGNQNLDGMHKSGSNMHTFCERIDKIEDLFQNNNDEDIVDITEKNLCSNCEYDIAKYVDKSLRSLNVQYQSLSLYLRKLSKNEDTLDRSIPGHQSTQLNHFKEVLISIEDDIDTLRKVAEDTKLEGSDLSAAIKKENETINDLEAFNRKLTDEINDLQNLGSQAMNELGYLSSLSVFHAKPLFTISEVYQSISSKQVTFYAINGFRLYIEAKEKYRLSWHEINAAWSNLVTLLICLRNRGGLSDIARYPSHDMTPISTTNSCIVHGLRLIPLRGRSIIVLLGSRKEALGEVSETSLPIKYLYLEGASPVKSKDMRFSDPILHNYRSSIIAISLYLALTAVELLGSSSVLPPLLTLLYEAASFSSVDFGEIFEEDVRKIDQKLGRDEDDDWDNSFPDGRWIEEDLARRHDCSNIFQDFSCLSQDNFVTLLGEIMTVCKNLV